MNNVKMVLSVNEVANLLGLSRNSTYEGVRRGEIPHIRVGKRLLIPRAALEAMLNRAASTTSNRQDTTIEYQ